MPLSFKDIDSRGGCDRAPMFSLSLLVAKSLPPSPPWYDGVTKELYQIGFGYTLMYGALVRDRPEYFTVSSGHVKASI
jgi:hypothetical protein